MAGDTINDVLDAVRGTEDPGEVSAEGWQDRAREAIAAENAKGDGARPTLIAKLEAALATEGPLVDDPTVAPELEESAPVDEGDGTAWYHTARGDFHVTIGSEAEKRLLEEQAERIAPPV